MSYPPVWAVVGWFVPVMNLWRPYVIARAIWVGSGSATHSGSAGTRLLMVWWALWLARISLACGPRALLGIAESGFLLQLEIALEALGCLAAAGSAYAGLKMVAGIDARQSARHDEQYRAEQAALSGISAELTWQGDPVIRGS
jgi:Domain of unknown function (DUF4328)